MWLKNILSLLLYHSRIHPNPQEEVVEIYLAQVIPNSSRIPTKKIGL